LKHLVFFASGSGTNFQSVIDAIQDGEIDARINGLITNNPTAKALKRAEQNGIPTRIVPPSSFDDQKKYTDTLLKILAAWEPHLIVLAGYMLKIPVAVLQAYPKRIINIHPSLLPKFGGQGYYGMKVHEAVLQAGESKTGCSVHIVTQAYDEGPVLAQRTVPVKPSDDAETLANRVLGQEHELLPSAIKKYLSTLN
jgi:formyltetrahydrofolate-dependent phosphoribosylglycinamide formyltransferase